jgi:hypothetical protein
MKVAPDGPIYLAIFHICLRSLTIFPNLVPFLWHWKGLIEIRNQICNPYRAEPVNPTRLPDLTRSPISGPHGSGLSPPLSHCLMEQCITTAHFPQSPLCSGPRAPVGIQSAPCLDSVPLRPSVGRSAWHLPALTFGMSIPSHAP